MNVIFNTGPGFYAAETDEVNKAVPKNIVRCYCARIEAYDISNVGEDGAMKFKLLAAMGNEKKHVAVALLKLRDALIANSAMLEESANRK